MKQDISDPSRTNRRASKKADNKTGLGKKTVTVSEQSAMIINWCRSGGLFPIWLRAHTRAMDIPAQVGNLPEKLTPDFCLALSVVLGWSLFALTPQRFR